MINKLTFIKPILSQAWGISHPKSAEHLDSTNLRNNRNISEIVKQDWGVMYIYSIYIYTKYINICIYIHTLYL